jgi:hypothetical protein
MPTASVKARSGAALYERDFYAWTVGQARALRDRRPADLDWSNLAEEIESVGNSSRSEIRNRMMVLLQYLLKWEYQPDERSNSWRASILEQRQRIADVLDESPSLKAYPASILEREYEIARLKAAGDTNLPLDRFPATTPYRIQDIFDPEYFPEHED